MAEHFRSGLVTIAGRPNVGKSTLLNRLVGQKLSITSPKPHTTRHRILGIHTTDNRQVVYVDTPGFHDGRLNAMNRYINRTAAGSLVGVDCIIMMITAHGWTDADDEVLQRIRQQGLPVILVINKIDQLKDKEALLPLLQQCDNMNVFDAMIPLSAIRGTNVEALEQAVLHYLPEQPPLFPDDIVTDRSERFVAAEFIREQLFRQLDKEVPHAIAVGIERFEKKKKIRHIHAVIWVEREGQKPIVVGKGGLRLKSIGTAARQNLENFFGEKVFLDLWVKVRGHWRDNDQALRSLGFGED